MRRMLLAVVPLCLAAGCFPYIYHEQRRVLVPGIDIDATLEIARRELEEGGFDATLTVWAMRDQVVTVEQARRVAGLYSTYIDIIAAEKDRTTADSGVWHFSWAISNLYRNGGDGIKAELEAIYLDARKRPGTLRQFKDIATEHVNGSKVYMGDAHAVARSYARSHLVVPGNMDYLQSLEQYEAHRKKKS